MENRLWRVPAVAFIAALSGALACASGGSCSQTNINANNSSNGSAVCGSGTTQKNVNGNPECVPAGNQ